MLLPAASLPGGTLAGAPRFLDWLAAAGMRWWQVLPLGPPDEHGSPYASPSAFAGWPGLLAAPEAPVTDEERAAFRAREAYWIDDWEAFAGPGALDDQVRFDREWSSVRRHAAERGIRIIGDVPFYVAGGSADVATHPHLFTDDAVAGVPPDDFSDDGQLWGNPPYDWDAMRADGYRWWAERLRRLSRLVDAVRIDHFRGFAAWWAVPPGADTARVGEWRPGPGDDLFRAVRDQVPGLGLIAEDLGVITPDVVALMERLGLPGIRVMQYAFNADPGNPHLMENHPVAAMVVTGTHDTDTIAAWWQGAGDDERRRAREEAHARGVQQDPPHLMLVGLALSSRAALAVVPIADLLGLGSEARINTPGTTGGNWCWRLDEALLDDAVARWASDAVRAAGRLPGAP